MVLGDEWSRVFDACVSRTPLGGCEFGYSEGHCRKQGMLRAKCVLSAFELGRWRKQWTR